MPRLYGHLDDPPGMSRGVDSSELVGAPRPTPDYVDNASFLRRTIDQRGSSCEGAGWCSAITLAGAVAGLHLDVSYLGIYAVARILEQPRADVLPDQGSYPYRVIDGLQRKGIVARHRWPDDSPLSARVPEDVFEAGSLAKVDGIYRVNETGSARFAAIEAVLARGLGVVCVMPVDQHYEDGPGALYAPPFGRSLGRHCQLLVGYERRKPGKPGRYKIKGSWGAWNGDGHVWAHEDVVAELMTDLAFATVAPPSVK